MADQDPLLGGISPDTTQQVLAMVLAQMAAQKKPLDPVANYLASLERQDEERKKQNMLYSQNQLSYPPNSARSGGQGQSGFGNIGQVYNVADTISKGYNGENLVSNVISLFG
jgi:hypothetical protein